MMDETLLFSPAVELARLVGERAVSPVELTELALRRIEALDDRLNSVVTVDPDGALAAARAGERAAGTPDAPPLLGVPVAIKDLHLTAGLRTTFGTASLAGFVPDVDEESVARIRRAGCVVLGKTNVPELGTLPVTEPVLHGPCRNPWEPTRTPGGSSGGAAAAVAAGLLPVAHGSDGAGSLRIPASNCGLVGLKPTRGRVSHGPLQGDGGFGLGSIGPVARYTADAAALLDAMRGYADGDPYWAPDPDRPFRAEVDRDPPPLRVGMVTAARLFTFSPGAVAVVEDAAALLEELGHRVESFALPVDEAFRNSFETVWAARLAAAPVDPSGFEPYNAALAERGRSFDAVAVLRAIQALQLASRRIVGESSRFDVVIFPTLTRPPLAIGELDGLDLSATLDALVGYVGYAPVANVTGQPSVSLPLGEVDGLPLGVTATGRPGDEATLLALSGQLERATGWPDRRPVIS